MMVDVAQLQRKFCQFLSWEKRKRREQSLLRAATVGLLLAIVLSPLDIFLPAPWWRWLAPIMLLCVVAPMLFYARRWHAVDARRAIVALDQKLKLEARAVTAWELAGRADGSPTAQLVFQQTADRLDAAQPRQLFPRRWRWIDVALAPLLLLWCAVLWFDYDQAVLPQRHVSSSLAQKLREFARDFQEKAKSEGLRQSLQLGQELEKLAQKNLTEQANDAQLKKDLLGVKQKLDGVGAAARQSQNLAGAESERSLRDLKAELDAVRDMLNLPDAIKAPEQWMERLASMPQLRKQLEAGRSEGQGLGQQELQSLLDRLDQQVASALDNRALIDAQKFLDQMMQQRQGQESNQAVQAAGQGEREESGDGRREKNFSNLPGKEPGKKDDDWQSLPQFRAETRSQIKGQLNAGESSGITFKGQPSAGKSEVVSQEVIANYRRQAEQQLNSEKVPAALKETVRKYFLSLDDNKR
jgi:hypothetical protein